MRDDLGNIFDGFKQCGEVRLHHIEFLDSQANENDVGNNVGEGKSIALFSAGFESDDHNENIGHKNDKRCIGFGNECGEHGEEGHGAEQFIVECPKQPHKCAN